MDLTLPLNGSIDRDSPAWTANLLDSYISTIDAFSGYDNVLAYNVGNEVVTSPNETAAAPFIKAAARDTKAYLSVDFVPVLGILLTLAFFLETPRSRLHSSAMPQSTVMPRGLFPLQTIFHVILPILPLIFMVSTISEYPVFKLMKTTCLILITANFVEIRRSPLPTLARRVLLRVSMWSHISVNMDATTRIPALGQTLLHCLAPLLLLSGPVALPFHTFPQQATLVNLAWSIYLLMDPQSQHRPTTPICKLLMGLYRSLTFRHKVVPQLHRIHLALHKTRPSLLQLRFLLRQMKLPVYVCSPTLTVNSTLRPPIQLA